MDATLNLLMRQIEDDSDWTYPPPHGDQNLAEKGDFKQKVQGVRFTPTFKFHARKQSLLKLVDKEYFRHYAA